MIMGLFSLGTFSVQNVGGVPLHNMQESMELSIHISCYFMSSS
jgi:hypothetical protein